MTCIAKEKCIEREVQIFQFPFRTFGKKHFTALVSSGMLNVFLPPEVVTGVLDVDCFNVLTSEDKPVPSTVHSKKVDLSRTPSAFYRTL